MHIAYGPDAQPHWVKNENSRQTTMTTAATPMSLMLPFSMVDPMWRRFLIPTIQNEDRRFIWTPICDHQGLAWHDHWTDSSGSLPLDHLRRIGRPHQFGVIAPEILTQLIIGFQIIILLQQFITYSHFIWFLYFIFAFFYCMKQIITMKKDKVIDQTDHCDDLFDHDMLHQIHTSMTY